MILSNWFSFSFSFRLQHVFLKKTLHLNFFISLTEIFGHLFSSPFLNTILNTSNYGFLLLLLFNSSLTQNIKNQYIESNFIISSGDIVLDWFYYSITIYFFLLISLSFTFSLLLRYCFIQWIFLFLYYY